MNKKKQLQFNLNNFLLSISTAFDMIEKEQCSTTLNHSKRLAYICVKLGVKFNLTPQEMSDLCAYALVHNIALTKEKKYTKEYFKQAQELVDKLPFLCSYKNIIKYHQEFYDGSGIFAIKDSKIPLMSQIISFAHNLEENFDITSDDIENRKLINEYVQKNENKLFSEQIVEYFFEISSGVNFWLDLKNENDILYYVFSTLYDFTQALDFEEVLELTSIFSNLNSENANFLNRCSLMCEFYKFEHKDKQTFLIAASLYNIGKLLISDKILKKDSKLSENEYEVVKSYPYYTKKILNNLIGFNDITNWASRAQESMDGSGYPFALSAKDLSLKDRLMAILNIYQALRTKKYYRIAYSHEETIEILIELANNGKIDLAIVNDIALELSKES